MTQTAASDNVKLVAETPIEVGASNAIGVKEPVLAASVKAPAVTAKLATMLNTAANAVVQSAATGRFVLYCAVPCFTTA